MKRARELVSITFKGEELKALRHLIHNQKRSRKAQTNILRVAVVELKEPLLMQRTIYYFYSNQTRVTSLDNLKGM